MELKRTARQSARVTVVVLIVLYGIETCVKMCASVTPHSGLNRTLWN